MLLAAAVVTIAAAMAVDLLAAFTASVGVNLNLPLFSYQPCVLILVILPPVLGLGASAVLQTSAG